MSQEPGPINPYAPPGAGGLNGGADRPPRPLWETVVLLLCGLTLLPFFLPETDLPNWMRLTIGAVAVAVLVWIAVRRLNGLRGTMATEAPPKLGGPKPHHVARKFESRR